MGQPGPYTEGVEHIRITIFDDILTKKGQDKAYAACDHPCVMVWITLECVGGSPRNHFNWVVGNDITKAEIVA